METNRIISIKRSITIVESDFPRLQFSSVTYNTLMKSPIFAGVIVEKEKPTKNAITLSLNEKTGLTEFTIIFHFNDFKTIVTQFSSNARKRNATFVLVKISTRAPRLIRERIMKKRTIPMRLKILILPFMCSHNCLLLDNYFL